MKREKLVTFLWSSLFAFGISFSGVACLITAFDMQVSLAQPALWCAMGAAACSLCFVLPLSLVPLGAGALACGYLWQEGSLELSVESLLYRLSRQYNQAYKWGLVRWTMRTADEMELTLTMALCALGILVALGTAWVICRRKPGVFSLIFGLLPLAVCLVVTDTVPDTLWLYVLLLGLTVLLLTSTVRRRDAHQGNRATAFMLVPVALALLILFAVSPQSDYTGKGNAQKIAETVLNAPPVQAVLGQFMEVNITGGGISGDSVDLRSAGVRVESRAEVLQVTADYTGTLYLRSRGLDAYDGVSWTDSGTDTSVLNWPTKGLVNVGEVEISTRFAHRMFYVPYYARGSQMKDMAVGLENDKHLTQYSFPCGVADESYQKSFLSSNASHLVINGFSYSEAFTHLSEDVRAWAEPLAQRLTQGVSGDYNKALIIGNYVRASAEYDLNTQAMPGNQKDFAKWFLEKSDTGYCVHFASAATVLLQAAGIPARYVTGYMVNTTEGKTVTVEARQAHAWAEYWLAGYGWVVLEATPPAPVVEVPTTELQPDTEPSKTPESTGQEIPDGQTRPADPTDQPQPGSEETGRGAQVLCSFLAVVALLAAIFGQYRLRRYLENRRLSKGTTNQQAITRWFAVVRLARHLGQQPPEALFQLAQKARFSQHILTLEELASFDAELENAQNRLKQRSVFFQIYYRLILALY